MEEAGTDDVVAGLFTTGVDAGMGVVRSPIELLVESITELVVGVDAAGVDVELQPTTLATRTAPAMIGRSLRIGGVYEVRATSAGWRGVQGARQVRPADAMPHPPHRCRTTTSSRSQATANRNVIVKTSSRYANATHLRGRRRPPRVRALLGPGAGGCDRARSGVPA